MLKLLFSGLLSSGKVEPLTAAIQQYTEPQVADMNHELVSVNQFKMAPRCFILVR